MRSSYVLYTQDGVLENFLTRDHAVEKVKKYHEQGVNAYIVSELEAKSIQESNEDFHLSKWE